MIYPSIPGELDLPLLVDAAARARSTPLGIWAEPDTRLANEYRAMEKLFRITRKIVDGSVLTAAEAPRLARTVLRGHAHQDAARTGGLFRRTTGIPPVDLAPGCQRGRQQTKPQSGGHARRAIPLSLLAAPVQDLPRSAQSCRLGCVAQVDNVWSCPDCGVNDRKIPARPRLGGDLTSGTARAPVRSGSPAPRLEPVDVFAGVAEDRKIPERCERTSSATARSAGHAGADDGEASTAAHGCFGHADAAPPATVRLTRVVNRRGVLRQRMSARPPKSATVGA